MSVNEENKVTEPVDDVNSVIDEVLPDEAADNAAQAAEGEDKPALRSKASMDQARRVAEQRKADRQAGFKAAESAFSKRLKEAGFESVDQVVAFKAERSKVVESADSELKREYQALANENRGLKGRITALEKQLAEARSARSAVEQEMEIRHLAYEAEVDPEYIDAATTALQRAYRNLDSKAAKEFDPAKWLKEDLRNRKPGIFRQALKDMTEKNVVEKPVNTAPAGSAPKAATATEAKGAGETATSLKNAMKMNRRELDEALASRGLINPARSVS